MIPFLMMKAHCLDCDCDVREIGEITYMVRDSLWRLAMKGDRYRGPVFLCIGCIEKRIDRLLDEHDFDALSVNEPGFGHKSDRLLSRLRGWEEIYAEAARRSEQETKTTNALVVNRVIDKRRVL